MLGFKKMKNMCDQERLPEAENLSVQRSQDQTMVSHALDNGQPWRPLQLRYQSSRSEVDQLLKPIKFMHNNITFQSQLGLTIQMALSVTFTEMCDLIETVP